METKIPIFIKSNSNKEYFPINLLSELIDHMKNPKSSFCYDINLSKKLDLYDNINDNVYLDQLNDGEIFYYRNLGKFKKINKRRKRYLCLRMIMIKNIYS